MNDKRWLILIGLLCGLVLLTGCFDEKAAHQSVARKRLWPSAQGFPDREIVFQVVDESEHDVFGFIRPDGSGLITRTVAPGTFTVAPTWSPDGRFIAFRAMGLGGADYWGGGFPWVISAEGRTVGWCYEGAKGAGRIWVTAESRLVFALGPDDEDRSRIVLTDFSCKVLATLYEVSSEGDLIEYLDSATLSSQGLLAMSRFFVQERRRVAADVVVIDLDSKEERVVGHGLAPAWSRDGEWLAFTGVDGIYIVRKDGSQMRRVVAMTKEAMSPRLEEMGLWEAVFTASWSPDGQWLVYQRLTLDGPIIYKVNIGSGEEVEVFRGGAAPDWRWDLALAGE